MTLADFVSSLPREEQVRLADKFNEAFSGEDFGCESFANHPLGRTESMSDDLRCSCGFADKVEAALERIVSSTTHSGHRIFWDFHEGKLGYPWMNIKENKQGQMVVDVANSCDLPAAIFELADKVDPPPQKERGSRVGDELESHFGRIIITAIDLEENNITAIEIGTGKIKEYYKCDMEKGEVWKNSTIEAELAGEK